MCLLEISGQIIPVQEVNRQQGFGANKKNFIPSEK
jgi:hypothetical protein